MAWTGSAQYRLAPTLLTLLNQLKARYPGQQWVNSPQTGTTTLGLHISAGARTVYVRANCHLGPLNPPDPRIFPFLPVELR
jgi:hypothetical protein